MPTYPQVRGINRGTPARRSERLTATPSALASSDPLPIMLAPVAYCAVNSIPLSTARQPQAELEGGQVSHDSVVDG